MTDARKDIVERLREPVMLRYNAEQVNAERREAAIEIERLRSLPGTREEVARIIDPNFLFWDFAVPNSFQQKRKDRALAKADAILALPPAPMPEREGTRETIHLGDPVSMNETAPYFHEWRGVNMRVVSLRLAPDGQVLASVIEGEPRHRGDGYYDGETSDIDVRHLSRAALAPHDKTEG